MDVGNFISGSSAFSKSSLYIWKFLADILLKPSLKDFEHHLASVWKVQLYSSLNILWHCLSLIIHFLFKCTGGIKYINNVVQCYGDFLWNFYWSTVNLQCCIHFCCIAKWLSYIHVYILLNFFSIVVYSRIVNGVPWATFWFLSSICNNLHLLTPDS